MNVRRNLTSLVVAGVLTATAAAAVAVQQVHQDMAQPSSAGQDVNQTSTEGSAVHQDM